MSSSLPAKAGTFAVAATLSALLGLGLAPLAGAAEGGNSASTPAADNANYGASATAPNSANASADNPNAPAYGQTGTTPADTNANGGNSADTAAAQHSQGQGGQTVQDNGSDDNGNQGQGNQGQGNQGQGASNESTSGQGNTPPGNNGTIKIHNVGTEATDHRNEPHVDCSFLVDFYGYDGSDGQATTMTFALISPTKPATADPYTHTFDLAVDHRTSGAQWDHREAFTADQILNGQTATAHPKQGYHVRLTVTVDDPLPQGAEVKHKVFWMQPCETTVQPTTEETGTTGSPSVNGESFTNTVPSATAASEMVSAAVLGAHFAQQGTPAIPAASIAQPEQPAEVQVMGVHYSRSALATTGAAIASLLGLGGVLLAAGWALTRASRRRSAA